MAVVKYLTEYEEYSTIIIVNSYIAIVEERVTHLCTEFPLLSWIATVLEGLFDECHSSSAALGQQRPGVTKTTTG